MLLTSQLVIRTSLLRVLRNSQIRPLYSTADTVSAVPWKMLLLILQPSAREASRDHMTVLLGSLCVPVYMYRVSWTGRSDGE